MERGRINHPYFTPLIDAHAPNVQGVVPSKAVFLSNFGLKNFWFVLSTTPTRSARCWGVWQASARLERWFRRSEMLPAEDWWGGDWGSPLGGARAGGRLLGRSTPLSPPSVWRKTKSFAGPGKWLGDGRRRTDGARTVREAWRGRPPTASRCIVGGAPGRAWDNHTYRCVCAGFRRHRGATACRLRRPWPCSDPPERPRNSRRNSTSTSIGLRPILVLMVVGPVHRSPRHQSGKRPAGVGVCRSTPSGVRGACGSVRTRRCVAWSGPRRLCRSAKGEILRSCPRRGVAGGDLPSGVRGGRGLDHCVLDRRVSCASGCLVAGPGHFRFESAPTARASRRDSGHSDRAVHSEDDARRHDRGA